MSIFDDAKQFGADLASGLNEYAGITENGPSSLDSLNTFNPNELISYGKLGKLASMIDQSAQRQYLDSGFLKNVPRELEILTQQPEYTILIKKRMFASLSPSFNLELMDQADKLYYRASKKLFANKCAAIAAYEKLSKIERIASDSGILNNLMLPLIFSAVDAIDQTTSLFSKGAGAQVKSVFDKIKKVGMYSEPNYTTTWIQDKSVPGIAELGDGTGVFEITSVTSFNTNVSLEFGGGSSSFNIDDPYRLSLITEEDVYRAIRETANSFSNNAFFKISEFQLEEANDLLRSNLAKLRSSRGASSIRFFINQDSVLFKKVRAVIDEEGRDINFHYDGGLLGTGASVTLDPSAFLGVNALRGDEVDLFKQIISNTYILFGIRKNNQNTTFAFNKENSYVIRKMMMSFAGKNIIQPQDVVHVFISSKSAFDSRLNHVIVNKLSSGDILNSINDSIGAIESSLENLTSSFGGGKDTYAVIEKDAIAGPDFPMWLWSMMRNDFTRQAAGTHVFAGLVTDSENTIDAATYTLRVSAKDHVEYFRQGMINKNPSVDVWNGDLYDPLTPFDLDLEGGSSFARGETPTLLPENRALMNAGILRFDKGRHAGRVVNEKLYTSIDGEKTSDGKFRKLFNDPPGLVYRWKEGIQTKTYNSSNLESRFRSSDTSPNIFSEVFAGQDVMNVLSLLVTGQPYDFNNFIRSAVNSGGIQRNELSGDTSSKSFIKGLIGQLGKRNDLWGNFVPFKKVSLNTSAYAYLQTGELELNDANRSIQQKIRQRAERFDILAKMLPSIAQNPQYFHVDENGGLTNASPVTGELSAAVGDVSTLSKLTGDILNLDFEITQQKASFQNAASASNQNNKDGAVTIFGNDITFDPQFSRLGSQTTENRERYQAELRNKLNYLTQRRLWRVKANEDPNLFIVDDAYDKNHDIQVFSKKLAGPMELFKSDYNTIDSQISDIKRLLDLEVYADTQGHIQVRFPQYNKIPSSIFAKLISQRDTLGIKLFPSYLENLFTNQLTGIIEKLETVEDEIRIRAAALGKITDVSATSLLSSKIAASNSEGTFIFLTNEKNGLFGSSDIRNLIFQANPAVKDKNNALKEVEGLASLQNTNRANFDILQRLNFVNENSLALQGVSEVDVNKKIEDLGRRLSNKSGQPIINASSLLSGGRTQSGILAVTEQIARFVADRFNIIKILTSVVKNLQDAELLNSGEGGKTLLQPYLNKSKQFPTVIEHMIEDEDVDDFGYQSGKRFIIKESQVKSGSFKEEKPQFTSIQVKGLLGEGFVEPESGLNLADGGNGQICAWAVDFDMWKNYGLQTTQAIDAPFLSDPDTQCAPFAVFKLNQARKNIFQGSLTIAGNEFIQPGEVYYYEGTGMLYYCIDVSHSFSVGQDFSTTLKLAYGRTPGEYIPSPLDIIGKALYVNKNQSLLARNNRFEGNGNSIPLGTLIITNEKVSENNTSSAQDTLFKTSYGDFNRKTITSLTAALGGLFLQNQANKTLTLELRIYTHSVKVSKVEKSLQDAANAAIAYIKNPSNFSQEAQEIVGESKTNDYDYSDEINTNIVVKEYDLANVNVSPSKSAWARARELKSGVDSNPALFDNGALMIDVAEGQLYRNVIDCWAVYSDAKPSEDLGQAKGDSESAIKIKANLAASTDRFNKLFKGDT